jgi:hypothetical protein
MINSNFRSIFLYGLRKTTKTLSQDSRCCDLDKGWAHPKWESTARHMPQVSSLPVQRGEDFKSIAPYKYF